MQANYANALCHLNATPFSAAVLAPCAWGESVVWRKWSSVWAGGLLSLSLSLSLSLLALFGTLKFLNTLFLDFLRSSLRAVFAKMAHFVILSVAKNPHKLKENLPFLDTSLPLSMTKPLSFWAFCKKAKNPHLKGAIHALNLWILR